MAVSGFVALLGDSHEAPPWHIYMALYMPIHVYLSLYRQPLSHVQGMAAGSAPRPIGAWENCSISLHRWSATNPDCAVNLRPTSWRSLPPRKSFRCDFAGRQIAVKRKFGVWVTSAERDAMARVQAACPNQRLPEAGYGLRPPPTEPAVSRICLAGHWHPPAGHSPGAFS